jgi:hypothetical protein
VLLRVPGLPKPSVVYYIPTFTVRIPRKDHPTTIVVWGNYRELLDEMGAGGGERRGLRENVVHHGKTRKNTEGFAGWFWSCWLSVLGATSNCRGHLNAEARSPGLLVGYAEDYSIYTFTLKLCDTQ